MRWVGMLMLAIGVTACTAPGPKAPAPGVVPAGRVQLGAIPPATFAIGYRLIKSGEYAQARASLESIRDYEPLHDYVLFYLGVACARTGANPQALALWAELSEQYPQSLLTPEALLQQGRLFHSAGDSERARTAFEGARGAGPRSIALAARLELADLDLDAGRVQAAADEMMAVRRATPGSLTGRRAKERLADLRERHPELQPHGSALEDELDVLFQERDYAGALGVIDALVERTPTSDLPVLLRRKADAQFGAGQLREALTTLDDMVARYPRSSAAPAALFRASSLRWNKDLNADAQRGFLQMRREYPADPLSADALYALARIAYGAGDRAAAQQQFEQLARQYPRHKLAHESRWRIGWMQYEAQRWNDAAVAFERARQAATGSAVDAAYWRGRSLEHAGDGAAARGIYQRILSDAPASYYSLWAEERLGGHPARITPVAPVRRRDLAAPPGSVARDFHFERARALQQGDLSTLAGDELRAFERANERSSGLTRYLVDAYLTTDSYRDAARMQRAAGMDDPTISYPLAYWDRINRQTAGTSLDPLLVIALMRQESAYNPRALSPADARGLLQLLPSTAAHVVGHPVSNEALFDPETNIEIGISHLTQLLQHYNGDVFKTLAAYNGGEDAVAKWERRFPDVERDEFVESITYRETRDYVKKVLSHYRRYQQLYATDRAG